MRPSRTLFPLISSLVLCIAAWTSDVYALPIMTVKSGTSATVHNISFTQVTGTPPAGCLTGFLCFKISDWTGSKTFGTGSDQITITTNPGFTSGPIASIKDSSSAAAFAFNGGIFQGFNTGSGQLTITFQNVFGALTSTNPTFGLVESGAFLQPGGNVQGDTLSMLGTVIESTPTATTTNIAQISKTAGSGATSSYSLNLSPTVPVSNPATGVTLKYTWTYNYTNSGSATSKFSDPEDCEDDPNACNTLGGGGAILANADDPTFAVFQSQFCSSGCEDVPVPEPSSVLLLGVALLSVGLFFAPRLKKKRETR